jgi:GT2 family glycosyltransferase
MRLLVVILNYRSADLTVDCLRSLAPEAPGNRAKVLVVDNASGDGSVERISRAIGEHSWGEWASVLSLARNGGFAFGNNAGIRAALQGRNEYVLLLNPDTLVRPGAIRTMLEFMDSHPDVGICGGSQEDEAGVLQHTAHRFPSPLGELDRGARLGVLRRLLRDHADVPPALTQARPCDWVGGACMMIRRNVFEAIGLLDEGYFLYYEEVDFCARAATAGFKVCFVPQARIVHFEGQATGIGQIARRRGAYWYDSRRRFFVKRYGLPGLIAGDMLWAIGRLTYVVRRALGLGDGGGHHDPKRFAIDLLWGDLRAVLSGDALTIRRGGLR